MCCCNAPRSCTGPALGGGAADARANSAFSPWVLILTADLQLVSLFEWPSAWSLRNASSTRICSAAWITDGSLLSLLDSNGNLVMLDSQGVVHSLVARRSSNGEPTGEMDASSLLPYVGLRFAVRTEL